METLQCKIQDKNVAVNDIERKHRNGRYRTETSQWKIQNGNIAMEDTERKHRNGRYRKQNENITALTER